MPNKGVTMPQYDFNVTPFIYVLLFFLNNSIFP